MHINEIINEDLSRRGFLKGTATGLVGGVAGYKIGENDSRNLLLYRKFGYLCYIIPHTTEREIKIKEGTLRRVLDELEKRLPYPIHKAPQRYRDEFLKGKYEADRDYEKEYEITMYSSKDKTFNRPAYDKFYALYHQFVRELEKQ